MTNDSPDESQPSSDDPTKGARGSFRDALRGLRRAASEVADAGTEEARKLAEAARPEIERRAQQAKAAAEAARPHVEQKAREATSYVREHQDEIVRASKRGAEVAASGAARAVTPGPLRPALDAMERELRDPPADDAATDGANIEGDAPAETSDDSPDASDEPSTSSTNDRS